MPAVLLFLQAVAAMCAFEASWWGWLKIVGAVVVEVKDGEGEVDDGVVEVDDGVVEVDDGVVEVNDGVVEVDDGMVEKKTVNGAVKVWW